MPVGNEVSGFWVTQAAHGFVRGQVVYHTGVAWALAVAGAIGTTGVGIVTDVSTNAFRVGLSGPLAGLTGLTPGAIYYLSPTVPGATTLARPAVAGQFIQPVFVAYSTTAGIIHIGGAHAVPGAAAGGLTVVDHQAVKVLNDGKATTDTAIDITNGGALDVQNGDLVFCHVYARHDSTATNLRLKDGSGGNLISLAVGVGTSGSFSPVSNFNVPIIVGATPSASLFYMWDAAPLTGLDLYVLYGLR